MTDPLSILRGGGDLAMLTIPVITKEDTENTRGKKTTNVKKLTEKGGIWC